MEHVKLTKIRLRGGPLNERWIQEKLADDPALLGLGDLDVWDVERRQPNAGRLDMLLTDPDSSTRYEVELQLGRTDESHIIRTIEYWDTERRRYPQYEHVAVIIAEEITSRFFNVISLFNGFIPIIAIQMTALSIDSDKIALVFTKVLDHAVLGTDEDDRSEPTDRSHWERKSSPEIMDLVDKIHSIVAERDHADAALSYKKYFIGLVRNGVANNYVSMQPRKKWVIVNFRIRLSDEVTNMIDESGIGTLPYDKGFRQYRLRISRMDEVERCNDLLDYLIDTARNPTS